MDPVRLGVVGCGVIGPTHMQAAVDSPRLELVAVADLIEERAAKAAERFAVPKTYLSGSELLDDPGVEAVVLAFPTGTRTALALEALAKGKHVLLEKPVAMSCDEVRQMMAARGDRQVACCSSRMRFLESARVAAELIASGALGPLRVVRHRCVQACGPKPEQPRPDWRMIRARNGGGYLVNWGCYDLDYLLGITGWTLKPTVVLAQTWRVPPQFESHIWSGSDAEAHYAALVRCEGGAVLTLERGEYMAAETENAWQVVGTQGSLTLQMTRATPWRILHTDTSTEEGAATSTLWEGDEAAAKPLSHPAVDLAEAIRLGRRPATDLDRSLVVQQITDAIYASAASGQAVAVG